MRFDERHSHWNNNRNHRKAGKKPQQYQQSTEELGKNDEYKRGAAANTHEIHELVTQGGKMHQFIIAVSDNKSAGTLTEQ